MFVSGDLSLDYVGTVQHRRTDATDLLTTATSLARWLAAARVVDGPIPVSDEDLDVALRLREAIYRMACAAVNGSDVDAEDRRQVNGAAAAPPVRLHLAADGSLRRSGDIAAALATVARAAIELLAGDLAELITECGAAECTRLYVDRSARRSRRWCDMRQCGNRAKAATFRSRHAPTH
jgi:predicted RNA-binding Zn ribbon-like protein